MKTARTISHAIALSAAFLIYSQTGAELSGMRRAMQILAGGQSLTISHEAASAIDMA